MRLCSLARLDQGRALVQVSGGPGPRILRLDRHRRPARQAPRPRLVAKRSGSAVEAGLGPREPAGPGTATVASRAMSATLATTSGVARRTRRYHGSTDPTDFDAGRDQIGILSASSGCRPRSIAFDGPLDLAPNPRAALARVVRPHDPVRAGTCLAHDADRRWPGHGRRSATSGTRCAPRRSGPGADRALAAVPELARSSTPTAARSRPATRSSATWPGASRASGSRGPGRCWSRSSRPSSSRRSPARRRSARWPGLTRVHGEAGARAGRVAPAAAAGARRRSPPCPTTRTTRSASSSAAPRSSVGSPRAPPGSRPPPTCRGARPTPA